MDSLYLSWLKVTGNTAACSGIGDCETVANSRYSEIGGIPIALIGVLGYLLIIALVFLEMRRPQWTENLTMALFGVTLIGTLYSAYLTYLELAVLRAICPFCIVSAIVMVLLFILSIFRLREIDVVGERGG
ncbi:MAG: vitamin K epoxide reductase [Anaerolineales bacterium]|nr:vitamin K epoxide reductase [Anaerolineales bacterium]